MKKSRSKKPKSATASYESLLEHLRDTHYVLRLYVTGATAASTKAIANLKKICEERLKGRYELEVIDIYQQPARARAGDVIVAPTLVKELPLPLKRLIGDLSNEGGLLAGLDLLPLAEPPDQPSARKRSGSGKGS
jgi:circadian clock protein KaiB